MGILYIESRGPERSPEPKPREPPRPEVKPALVLYVGSCPSFGYRGLSVSEGWLFPDSADEVEQQRYADAMRLVRWYRRTGQVQIHGDLFNNDADAERFIAFCLARFPNTRAGVSLTHSGHGEIVFRKDISLEGELDEKKARGLLKEAGFKIPSYDFDSAVIGKDYRSRRTRAT